MILSVFVLAQPLFSSGSSMQPKMSPYASSELKKENVGEDTESLLGSLTHKNATVRWIAAQEMGKRKVVAAIPELKDLLQDHFSVVKYEAAGALLEMGDQSGVPTLKALLDSKFQWDFVAAARILATYGDDSGLDKVRPLLQSSKAVERLDAIKALGASHNPTEAYPALRQGTKDEDESTRCIALNMLKKRATPEAIEIVAGMLQSTYPADRRMATSVLIQVHKVEAIPYIIDALGNEDDDVRMSAAVGITYLAGHKIAPSTKKMVKNIEDAKRVQSEWRKWWEQNKASFTLGPQTRPQFED